MSEDLRAMEVLCSGENDSMSSWSQSIARGFVVRSVSFAYIIVDGRKHATLHLEQRPRDMTNSKIELPTEIDDMVPNTDIDSM